MTVEELIAHLLKLPPDMDIIVASDEEGNDWDDLYYAPSVSWCVEDDTRCGLRPVHPDDIGTEYEQDELVQRVVL